MATLIRQVSQTGVKALFSPLFRLDSLWARFRTKSLMNYTHKPSDYSLYLCLFIFLLLTGYEKFLEFGPA